MSFVIIFCIGLLVGGVLVQGWSYMHSVGSLRIDDSDPDEDPYIFLELFKDASTLYKKKYITLKVNIKSFIPRK